MNYRDLNKAQLIEEIKRLRREVSNLKKKFPSGEMSAQLHRFYCTVHSLIDAVIITDTGRRIVYANPALETIHGYRPLEVVGKSSHYLFGDIPGNPADLSDVVQRKAQDGFWVGEVYNRKKDGTVFLVQLTVNTIFDEEGDVLGYIGISRDITHERKTREAENAAYERIKKIDRLKSKFLSSVSHELRIPLTSIRAFSQILLNYDEDKATRQEFLGIINHECERLIRMINDLLDLSKIEAGKMEWKDEFLNLTDVTAEAMAALEGIAREKSVRFTMDESAIETQVCVDRDRIQQVLVNLLSNAIKYSPEGGEVIIILSPQKRGKKKWVKVSVTDQGPGIPVENRKIIFQKFKQLGAPLSGKPLGIGLGLSICREIIRHYEGKIWVAGKEDKKGCTFCFNLPLD